MNEREIDRLLSNVDKVKKIEPFEYDGFEFDIFLIRNEKTGDAWAYAGPSDSVEKLFWKLRTLGVITEDDLLYNKPQKTDDMNEVHSFICRKLEIFIDDLVDNRMDTLDEDVLQVKRALSKVSNRYSGYGVPDLEVLPNIIGIEKSLSGAGFTEDDLINIIQGRTTGSKRKSDIEATLKVLRSIQKGLEKGKKNVR